MLRIGSIAFFAATAITVPALGGTLKIELDFEFSGAAAPAGAGPWAIAIFTDHAPGVVRLTMQQHLNDASEFLAKSPNGGWRFNVDHAMLPLLAFSHVSGEVAASIGVQQDHFKADGDGYFDINMGFAGGIEFGDPDVVYDISAAGLTAAHFNHVSVNGPVGKNGFLSAVHVQGIGSPSSGQGTSGWIAPDGTTIPLPSAGFLALGGLGLMAAGRNRVLGRSGHGASGPRT